MARRPAALPPVPLPPAAPRLATQMSSLSPTPHSHRSLPGPRCRGWLCDAYKQGSGRLLPTPELTATYRRLVGKCFGTPHEAPAPLEPLQLLVVDRLYDSGRCRGGCRGGAPLQRMGRQALLSGLRCSRSPPRLLCRRWATQLAPATTTVCLRVHLSAGTS